MHISFKELTLKISEEEAFVLYSTIKQNLATNIKEHWKNHPDSYPKMEEVALNMMRQLARFTGHDFEYDSGELKKLLDGLKSKLSK